MHGVPGVRHLAGRAAAAAVICATTLFAHLAHADEPLPPEADTNPQTRPQPHVQLNLILVGAAVTAGWYGVAAGTSYLWSDSDGAPALRIPVAGPYMALAKTGCGAAEGPDCDTLGVVVRTVFTVLSAVGQTGGVLVLGEGLFMPTAPRARRGDAPAPTFRLARARPGVAMTPTTVGRNGFGLTLSGNF